MRSAIATFRPSWRWSPRTPSTAGDHPVAGTWRGHGNDAIEQTKDIALVWVSTLKRGFERDVALDDRHHARGSHARMNEGRITVLEVLACVVFSLPVARP